MLHLIKLNNIKLNEVKDRGQNKLTLEVFFQFMMESFTEYWLINVIK